MVNTESLYNDGETLYEQERYEEALHAFTAAHNATLDSIERAECINYMGCCQIALYNYAEALRLFDEALILSPNWERLHFTKGVFSGTPGSWRKPKVVSKQP